MKKKELDSPRNRWHPKLLVEEVYISTESAGKIIHEPVPRHVQDTRMVAVGKNSTATKDEEPE